MVLMLVHEIKFDVNSEFEENSLEDLASSNGEYWVHCKKEEIMFF